MKFSHGGAMGDMIFHLAVVRELGGGEFYILSGDRDGYRTKACMQYRSMKPLLDVQSYLTKVEWADSPQGVNFEGWRRVVDFNLNLVNQAAAWLGMPAIPDTCPPWIECGEPNSVAPLVVNRSLQRNFHPAFPWNVIPDKFKGKSVFLGTPGEHEAFVREVGYIPYYPTKSMLEAAQVIKGSKYYLGNACGLQALAEAMKHRYIVSSAPHLGHCVSFNRPGAQHCWDAVELWEV